MDSSLELQVRNFLIEGTTLEAIRFFHKFPNLNPAAKKELSLLEHRSRKNNSLFIRGLTTLEQSRVEENKIVITLLDLLENEPMELNSITISEEGQWEKILLISRTEQERETEHELLKRFKFRNIVSVTAQSYETLLTKLRQHELAVSLADEKQKPLITIWDNRDLKSCPEEENLKDIGNNEANKIHQRLPFLEECMENDVSEYYMHYGEQFFFVSDNRHRVYSANSRFALVGRLFEMLDYIKAYGG